MTDFPIALRIGLTIFLSGLIVLLSIFLIKKVLIAVTRISTEGKIVDIAYDNDTNRTRNSDNNSTIQLIITYRTLYGEVITTGSQERYKYYNHPKIGKKIKVYYNPKNFKDIAHDKYGDVISLSIAIAIMLILTIVTSYFFFFHKEKDMLDILTKEERAIFEHMKKEGERIKKLGNEQKNEDRQDDEDDEYEEE